MNKVKIAVVVLNYNNSNDTIACIKSILSQTVNNFSLIIVDNSSTDTSYNDIHNYLHSNKYEFKEYNESDISNKKVQDLPLINLILASSNYGYAKGNNIGLRLALEDDLINYFWVLNNDTIVHENAISIVHDYLQQNQNKKEILGTLLLRFYQQNIIQALGGKYFPIIGKTKLFFPNLEKAALTQKHIEVTLKNANYLIGASLIFSKLFLTEVGLFSEDYFLYAEEADIVKRGKKSGYSINLICDAIVYHKEGGTTNVQSKTKKERNTFIEYHNSRSKLLFSKTYYPFLYPVTFLCVLANLFIIYRTNVSKAFGVAKKLVVNRK